MRALLASALSGAVLLAGLLAAPAGPARAGLMDGLAAYGVGDYPRAYALLKPPAQRGVPEAQFRVGWVLVEGRAGRLAIGRGLAWLDRAYRGGHDRAGLAYATVVVRERLDGPAAARAEAIFLALIDCGMPAAMTNYAYWLNNRRDRDPEKVTSLNRQAAYYGHAVAQNNYSLALLRAEDYVDGSAWAMIAARSGSEPSRELLDDMRPTLVRAGLWPQIVRRAGALAAGIDPRALLRCAD